MLSSANVAAAEVTLGSTTMPSGSTAEPCFGPVVIAQATSDPSTPFTAPSRGTITGWQINPIGASSGSGVTLVVLRPAAGGAYSVVGVDPETIPLGGGASFTASIPVEAGDTLGIYTGTTEPPVCYFSGGSTPASASLMAFPSLSQPSPGQTFSPGGPNSPGGYRLNLAATFRPEEAAVLPPPPAPLAPPGPKCTVLRLTRAPVSVAKSVLSALGCTAGKTKRAPSGKVPKGTVIKTTPRVGSYPAGQKVGLVISSGPKRDKQQKKS
ncbi:MAG TPA: PASTA domain-containing protein [Solirubrobacterales bacterium]|nr:PASTA domain-containing protein [Solirubrobacterales bacterium]